MLCFVLSERVQQGLQVRLHAGLCPGLNWQCMGCATCKVQVAISSFSYLSHLLLPTGRVVVRAHVAHCLA